MPTPPRDRKKRRVALGSLQAFISVGALAGGIGLVSDPSGNNVGMDTAALARSPFTSYLIPGLVLLVGIGGGHLLGAIASFRSWRRCREFAILLGAGLLIWISAQVFWIGLVHWLQPLYFALGTIQAGLGYNLLSSSKSTD